MTRKSFTCLLSTAIVLIVASAEAQQQARIAKIGELLSDTRPHLGTGRKLLRRELRNLGYVEGTNIVFESRSAQGNPERFAGLADELVRLKVDVLLTSSPDETLAAKNATRTIPIVFYAAGDPVASGLGRVWRNLEVISLASPPLQRF
jgi:putative tryptophan/tyrosine transport system substrate-binding protein